MHVCTDMLMYYVFLTTSNLYEVRINTFISILSANLCLSLSLYVLPLSCNISASICVCALRSHSQRSGTPTDRVILRNYSRLILEWHFTFYQSLFQLSPNYIKIILSFTTDSMDKKSKCRTQNCGDKLPIFIFLHCCVLLYAYIITYLPLVSTY